MLNNSYILSNNHKRDISYNQNSRNISQNRSLTEGNEYEFDNNSSFQDNNSNEISYFNIEQLFILENKLKDILQKLNSYQPCYNECFEWINSYFNSIYMKI